MWNHSDTQLNVKRKGNIFKATNVKNTEHLTAGQWVKKTQMEKSQSLYALVWSPVFCCSFSSLKVYPSQCRALRMHTCSATMIHIINTFGDDSNQKPEVNRQIIWRGLRARDKIFTAVREREKGMHCKLWCLEFWKEMSAYLRLPLRTKHTRVKNTKITRNVLQTNKYSKYHNTN